MIIILGLGTMHSKTLAWCFNRVKGGRKKPSSRDLRGQAQRSAWPKQNENLLGLCILNAV